MTNRSITRRILAVGMICLITVFVGCCTWLQSAPLLNGVWFILYNTVCILALGFSVLCILKKKTGHIAELAAYSYAVGYAAVVFLYMLLFPFLGKTLFPVFLWIIGGISVVFSVFHLGTVKQIPRMEKKEVWILTGIILFALAVQALIYAVNNFSVVHTGKNSYYIDLLYWASDAVTLSKQYPPVNFRDFFAGPYHYHYFSSIQIAVASMCTGIRVIQFTMGFAFLQGTLFLVFSGYAFYRKILRRPWTVAIALLLMFCTSGYEGITRVTITSHTYTAPFGNDIGMAFSMIIIGLLLDQMMDEKLRTGDFLLTTALFAACMGVKSPSGTITMLVGGLICLHQLFLSHGKNRIRGLLFGMMFAAVFLVMYVLVVSGMPGGASKAGYFLKEGAQRTVLNSPELATAHDLLIHKFGYFLGQLLFIFYFAILINPAVFLPFIAIILFKLLGRKKTSIDMPLDAFMIASFLGLLLSRFLKMVGYSQMYFVMAVMPFTIAAIVYYIQRLSIFFEERDMLRCFRAIRIGILFLIFMAAGLFFDSQYFRPQLTSALKKLTVLTGVREDENIYLLYEDGYAAISDLKKQSKYTNGYIVLTEDMYDACLWMYENSDDSAMIASNVMRPKEVQYPIGILSERWVWTRDSSWIKEALTGRKSIAYRLKQDGVKYILTEKDDNDDEEQDTAAELLGAAVVFENDTTQVIDLDAKGE